MIKQGNIEKLHENLQGWRSYLLFVSDEMRFIERMLHSYLFEPRTPTQYKRWEQFNFEFKNCEKSKDTLVHRIMENEKCLGGVLECASDKHDHHYSKKYAALKTDILQFIETYQLLKTGIYNYAGLVLKKKKPLANV
ncbi:hypothetical protein [Flagellimonas sp. GZD32]|uniref:hypothetical protein n=1 Tax=Flagellimonas cixiensis TaxID=3228750 RepID=UPI0035C93723